MKLKYFLFLSIILFTHCTTSQNILTMKAPDKKPPVLLHENGLEDATGQLVYEFYKQARSGGAYAIKVYDNGDCYEFNKGRKSGLDNKSAKWNKIGTLDNGDLESVHKIIDNDAMDYINSPSQTKQDKPISYTLWYFHKDQEHFAYTQNQRFRFRPKFVRKLEKYRNF